MTGKEKREELIFIEFDGRDQPSLFGKSTPVRCAGEAGAVRVNIITVPCSVRV